MGASGWSYFVPYQTDIHRALHDIRLEVFRSGNYRNPACPDSRELTLEQFIHDRTDLTENDLEALEESYHAEIARLEIKPDSPDSLLEKSGYCGTHSIIDITDISTDFSDDISGPLPCGVLFELFGTDKPTHEMILGREREIQTFRGRWLCTFIIVYENNEPVEIYFSGYSGD